MYIEGAHAACVGELSLLIVFVFVGVYQSDSFCEVDSGKCCLEAVRLTVRSGRLVKALSLIVIRRHHQALKVVRTYVSWVLVRIVTPSQTDNSLWQQFVPVCHTSCLWTPTRLSPFF